MSVLVLCARLSWPHSAFESTIHIKLFCRIVS